MARRDYEVIQQCTSELRAMLEVDLFVGAAISVGLISRNEAQGTLKALKTSQMTAVLYILQLLEKKRKCLDLFLSALRKSVEGYLDQQHSHFQLITVVVKKKEETQHAATSDDVERSSEQVSDAASAVDSVNISTETDSNPPLRYDEYTDVVTNKTRSLPRSQSESQSIPRRSSRTLPLVNVYPTSHNQPPSGWNEASSPVQSHPRSKSSSSIVPTQEQPYENLLHKLKQIEVKMDQFMELMQKWKDNTEARMDAYDQFFRHQGAEQKKMQQSVAKLTRENEQLRKENQHTLDLTDVDLHEKDREGEAEEEVQCPLPVDGHRMRQSKEAGNEGFASHPRPTAKRLVGGAKHDDLYRHESD